MDRYPLGLNTYCLRAFRWPDLKLLEYAASLKLDAVFLQDSLDPGVNDPAQVRNAPEKLFVTHFPELMPPTLITSDKIEIAAFRREHGDIIAAVAYVFHCSKERRS